MPDSKVLKKCYDDPQWFDGGYAGGYENYDEQTQWSVDFVGGLLSGDGEGSGKSILDVGCGYGNHLQLAAQRGWKCFGVELSDHARHVAESRLGLQGNIVESVDDLLPHEFDLILMLDVIEHLPSPIDIFYQLFAKGAITPKTRLVITTPNAGSVAARASPSGWAYRHPPSHLVFFRPEALTALLTRLRFSDIAIRGMHPEGAGQSQPEDLSTYAGLCVEAKGSDFAEFMRERYVPGTWSKIAEYEHLPRYAHARTLAIGKRVLDLGCGTGYGASLLADVASEVIGLDIDGGALAWANGTHRKDNLRFVQAADLGASLPEKSFELITCFEMIEHVDLATQQATLASVARLLRPDGALLISTPNPENTKLYGSNPYHLREMTWEEFATLLGGYFQNVRIVEQHVCQAVTFAEPGTVQQWQSGIREGAGRNIVFPALAYMAMCSQASLPEFLPTIYIDREENVIGTFLAREQAVNRLRFQAYRYQELAGAEKVHREFRTGKLEREIDIRQQRIAQLSDALSAKMAELVASNNAATSLREAMARTEVDMRRLVDDVATRDAELLALREAKYRAELEAQRHLDAIAARDRELFSLRETKYRAELEAQRHLDAIAARDRELFSLREAKAKSDLDVTRLLTTRTALETQLVESAHLLADAQREISEIRGSRWFEIGSILSSRAVTWGNVKRLFWLISGGLLAYVRDRTARPVSAPPNCSGGATPGGHAAYVVRTPVAAGSPRVRVVHVIANFCTGGSSRLVVDLIERLGDSYEQSVITSHIPIPPAYENLDIIELKQPASVELFQSVFADKRPDFVHVHYWGDCDEPWYARAISAAEQLGIPVLENVNTPVAPYVSSAVAKYVFVSDYVRDEFGRGSDDELTIYPGSDFSHFCQDEVAATGEDCIGMVYRLEPDKLNEHAIQPFIHVVKMRPATRVLIVGGGSLLNAYRDAVVLAGVASNFEFSGYVSYESLPTLYRRIRVFVAPVWKESFGQVSPFAMSMGIPVCGYDVGGLREIVDAPELLAPAGEAAQLADIVVRLLDSPQERQSVAVKQQARARRYFSVEAMVERYRCLYGEMPKVSAP